MAAAATACEVTPFQRAVYRLAQRVPRGKVTTYGSISRALGAAPRAVGQALRHNPFAPHVPCHRIVASSLHVHGFSGSVGVETDNVKRKVRMLKEEGVRFSKPGVVDKECVHIFPPLQAESSGRGNAQAEEQEEEQEQEQEQEQGGEEEEGAGDQGAGPMSVGQIARAYRQRLEEEQTAAEEFAAEAPAPASAPAASQGSQGQTKRVRRM